MGTATGTETRIRNTPVSSMGEDEEARIVCQVLVNVQLRVTVNLRDQDQTVREIRRKAEDSTEVNIKTALMEGLPDGYDLVDGGDRSVARRQSVTALGSTVTVQDSAS